MNLRGKSWVTTLCKRGWAAVRPEGGPRSVHFLHLDKPLAMILVCYLDDTVGLLTQPFLHPRIDGGLQPFVLRHGLEKSAPAPQGGLPEELPGRSHFPAIQLLRGIHKRRECRIHWHVPGPVPGWGHKFLRLGNLPYGRLEDEHP